jgi:hypothetical protein
VLVPWTPEGIALAFVDANEVLYRRTKHGAEPLVEWALRWARRNVLADRTRPAFIFADTGQFLFTGGTITELYLEMVLDWAANGAGSEYVLPSAEVIERSAPRSPDESAAAAHFELGRHLQLAADHDGAVSHG